MNYRYATLLLIAVSALVKLALAGQIELNNDEAYYWTYAQHFQWNYFDHPPMVAVFIRIFTGNLLFHDEIFIRIGSVLTCGICTWILYKIGTRIKDERTGWIAACLYTASFYASVITGLLILPDTPQMLFWLSSVLVMLEVISIQAPRNRTAGNLLLLGIFIGLTMLSKVHGVFLWVGFLGYVIFNRRDLLRLPALYGGIIISAAMLAPSIGWTVNNHFATVNYHAARVGFTSFSAASFARELVGQVLYANPVNFVIIGQALFFYRRYCPFAVLLKWLSLPLILTVLSISFFNETLPHWSGPAYCTLLPLTAKYLRNIQLPGRTPGRVRVSLVFLCIALFALVAVIKYYPGSLGKKSGIELGAGDPSLDITGWKAFSDSLEIRMAGQQPPGCMITNFWFPGGQLAYYVSPAVNIPTRVVGRLNDIHHFAWLNSRLPALLPGQDAWFVTTSNYLRLPSSKLAGCFKTIDLPISIPQYRSGKPVRYFYIYPLRHYLGGLPANGVLE